MTKQDTQPPLHSHATMRAPAAKGRVGKLHHGLYGLLSAITIRCGTILISKYGIRLTACRKAGK